jgi:hypothetical protein
MTEPRVTTSISGGRQAGIIGAANVTANAMTFIIHNYDDSTPKPATAAEAMEPCPYPGLAYFGPNDADRFFGRDEAIDKLLTAVSRQSLTALVGASGSGKSSVVLAGLAPRLHGGGEWLFSYFRIGHELDRDPFLALARALVPLYVTSDDPTDRLTNTRKLAERLRLGELTLRDVFAECRSRNKSRRILLIADQFEEAFTLVDDDPVRHRFIDVLLAGFADPASDSSPDICLIVTLRADFYGRALLHRPLADALQGHVENLGPMNRAELRLAISRPAEDAKVSFDPGLVETLLDDVENKPGSLPLLQFALREMWGRQEERRITRTSYDAIGGVEGALAQRADSVFAKLTDNGADTQMERDFQRLFTRLVTLGEGQEDTRRVVERRELGEAVWLLAQRLADEGNRLVVTNAPALSHETAEVVHEALIRHWLKLTEWINRDRTFLSWLRQIKPNVDSWLADPTDEGPLVRGGMLAQASDWFGRRSNDLSLSERRYIEASIALKQREEDAKEAATKAELHRQQELAEAARKLAHEQGRRVKIAVGGVVLALLLAVLSGTATYYARQQTVLADRNEKIAQEQTARAVLSAKAATDKAAEAEFERGKAHMRLLAMQARREDTAPASPDDVERAGALALASIAESHSNPKFGPPEADAIEAARSAWLGLPLAILTHGGGSVQSLAVLADGRLASGGADGKIRLWPKEGTGEPMILNHGALVWSLAVLVDGRLASGGADGKIRLWPKEGTGEPMILSHGGEVISLAVLADGRLASGGGDGKIKLWPKKGTGEPMAVLNNIDGVRSLVVLADGHLASGDHFGRIRLWPKEGAGKPVIFRHPG